MRPLGRYQVNHKEQLSGFLKDILDNNEKIEHYVADNLKRATARDCLCHSSFYACEYCFAKAVRSENRDKSAGTKKQLQSLKEKLKGANVDQSATLTSIEKEIGDAEKNLKPTNRSHLVWPSSTYGAQERTTENMMEIVEKIEENGKLSIDESKGVVGRSPLFLIPNFNFVRDSPTEYLHSTCLGVGKKMVELTFHIGI